MTQYQLKQMLSDPFGSKSWKILDGIDRKVYAEKSDSSMVDYCNKYLESESNLEIAFIVDKQLKLYNTIVYLPTISTLKEFEVQLRKDEGNN